jgi:hypothetical protein
VAPGLPPDDTGLATTGDQADDMVNSAVEKVTEGDTNIALPLPLPLPLPHLKAGREVGWIFTNGEAVAIERHECENGPSEVAR